MFHVRLCFIYFIWEITNKEGQEINVIFLRHRELCGTSSFLPYYCAWTLDKSLWCAHDHVSACVVHGALQLCWPLVAQYKLRIWNYCYFFFIFAGFSGVHPLFANVCHQKRFDYLATQNGVASVWAIKLVICTLYNFDYIIFNAIFYEQYCSRKSTEYLSWSIGSAILLNVE